MRDDFELLWSTKIFFQGNIWTYDKFIELDMGSRKMIEFGYPIGNQWNNIAKFSGNNSSPTIDQASQSSRR